MFISIAHGIDRGHGAVRVIDGDRELCRPEGLLGFCHRRRDPSVRCGVDRDRAGILSRAHQIGPRGLEIRRIDGLIDVEDCRTRGAEKDRGAAELAGGIEQGDAELRLVDRSQHGNRRGAGSRVFGDRQLPARAQNC